MSNENRRGAAPEAHIAEAQRFFQAAGFRLGVKSQTGSFVCHPDSPNWRTKLEGDVYVSIVSGRPLGGSDVLEIREAAHQINESLILAVVLVEQMVGDDAWLQIAALRSVNFHVMPIPLSVLDESRITGEISDARIILAEGLGRFLGRSSDPYNRRDPVSDVLNFFGREALAKELIERLDAGRSIGLFGLRKMGKSSLMRYMQRIMPYPTAWVNLEAGVALPDLYERVIRNWQSDARGRLKIDLGLHEATFQSADPTVEFFKLTQNALDRSAKLVPEGRLAIFLDEIEELMPPVDAGASILQRYLSLMQVLRGLAQEDMRVSILTAGVDYSFNHIPQLGIYQNPFYKFLQEFPLPPLDGVDCIQMIRNIGRQVELSYTNDAATFIAQASGGHPFLARQLCGLAFKQQGSQPGTISLAVAQDAAERFIFEPQYSANINESGLWGEATNKKPFGGQAAEANRKVLLALARSQRPLIESEIVGTDSLLLRLALSTLQQLHIVRSVEMPGSSEQHYEITFGLLSSWIRRCILGMEE